MLIINVRGTNGSGKTTLIRSIIAAAQEPGGGKLMPSGVPYHHGNIEHRFAVALGDYSKPGCGGYDKVKTQQQAEDSVRQAAAGFVPDRVALFEGLLVSGLYQRWHDLDVALTKDGHKYVWGFMQTSLDECIARTRARAAAKGRSLDDPSNVISKFRAVERCRERALQDGRTVWDLDANTPLESIKEYLQANGL